MYFQFPLMVLIIAPAIDGLRREWLEAAENLGASSFHYWRYVAFPILFPAMLGAMILLFGNAFGAFATAQALTGGQINLVTIVIGSQLRGDILADPGLGYALALGMVVVMALRSWGAPYFSEGPRGGCDETRSGAGRGSGWSSASSISFCPCSRRLCSRCTPRTGV